MLKWIFGHWQLFVITAAIYALWNTDLIWPFRVLVVFFHEISHGIAAVLTGGSIEELSFQGNEGGVAWIRGGNRFWVASAGYLGSLLIGSILTFLAINSKADRFILVSLGVALIAVTALYVRGSFAVIFALVTGALMILTGWRAPRAMADLALRIIGLASMCYAPWDIAVDTVLPKRGIPSGMQTDAAAIAHIVGGTEVLWGIIWFLIAILVIAITARFCLDKPSNITLSDFRSQ